MTFAGKAVIALPTHDRTLLRECLARLTTDRAALPEVRRRKAEWVRPEIAVKVQHLKGSGMLRHAAVRSLSGRI